MRTFEFKKSYEEIKINDEVYKLSYNDENLLKYQKAFRQFQLDAADMQSKIDQIKTADQETEYYEQTKEMVKKTIDLMLGEGSFDKIYEQSDRSIFNMVDLLVYLGEIVEERVKTEKEERLSKYVKKASKKNSR